MGRARREKLLKGTKDYFVQNRLIIILSSVIVLTGFLILPFYKYQINPDGVSYIGVARNYAHGNFRDAINGYWGPLLSWLIVPAIWLKINPIVAIKILQVILVGIVILSSYKVIRKHASEVFSVVGAFVIGTIGLTWALAWPLTSDLLVLVASLSLLLLFESRIYSVRYQVLIGALGACLYFAKSVGFFLFIGFWIIWIISDFLFYSRKNLLKIARSRIISLVVFFILILPIVGLISMKYGKPTIGTAGNYNFALVGPHSVGHPMMTRLIPPPNAQAVSIWEDISNVPVTAWSPFDSFYNLKFFIHLVKNNFTTFTQILTQFGWAVFALGLFYLVLPARKEEARFKFVMGGMALLTTLAYLPVFIEGRYIMFALIASVIGFILLISKYVNRFEYRSLPVLSLGFFLALLLIGANINGLRKAVNINKDVYQQSISLASYIPAGSRVAGDDFGSIYVCYYLNAKCYGAFNPGSKDTKQQIENSKIQYLFLSQDSAQIIKNDGLAIKPLSVSYQGRDLYVVNQLQ
jgi:hypothetical protein